MKALVITSLALSLGACASVPTGPSVMVLPGSTKTFDEFQFDDAACRQWAGQQTGTTTGQASTGSAVSGAAVGTVVGAAAGAAIGAAAGNPGAGAAIGAGTGLLGGTAVGASHAHGAYYSVQQRYNMAFMQCMYAKGHQIPVARGSVVPGYSSSTPARPATPARPSNIPPPPAGSPPPPPPGVKG